MNVSVVIVNWNGKHYLGPCLDSLRASKYPIHQVIVVDNGSVDGSVDFLKQMDWSPLKCLFLNENRGFSGGNNAGLDLVTGDLVALLNNDTLVDPGWIHQAVPCFDDPAIGMVASKVVRLEDEQTIDKAGHLIYPDGLNRGRGTGHPDDAYFAQQTETLWPDGCAGFYRKSMLDEIGFFDDDFFLYGEDAELGMRARWAGYTCIFQPASIVRHHQSGSLGRFSKKKIYYVERNRLWVLLKTFPVSYILVSPWYTLCRYVMNVASLFVKRGSAAGFRQSQSGFHLGQALILAIFHGLGGALKMVAKRKHLLRRIATADMKRLLKKHRISVRELALMD